MPTVVDLGRAAKQAHPEYADVDDAELGRAVQKANPGSYDEFTELTTAGTGRTGARLKGTPSGGSPILPMATAAMIGGPILGEAAGLLPLGKAAVPKAPEGGSGLPEMGLITRGLTHLIPGGRYIRAGYDFIRGMQPEIEQPTAPEPFRPNPNIARQLNRSASGGTPPLGRLKGGPIKTGKVTGGAAPTPSSGQSIQPVGESPLPSNDWRFEEQRDMARLLNQHDIDPNTMDDEHWAIAAPALNRGLGIPNATARSGVINEWNKLRGQ